MLKGKTIILGVSASIAAYKSCEIIRRLRALGVEVRVVMTEEAAQLISPLTFSALSGFPVITSLFDEKSSDPLLHISLAQDASALVIAPATANIISKFACGIADDALTTFALSFRGIKLIAPAMHGQMWRNAVIQENVAKLQANGWLFIGPIEGPLASGSDDVGRMVEPQEIVEAIIGLLFPRQNLKGKEILVTAGPTREALDPARYISNRSSGKMGYALAQAAREKGAQVTLVSGPTSLPAPLDIRPIKVETAAGMLDAVLDHSENSDALIMAAAVSDFKPVAAPVRPEPNKKGKVNFAATKIKRSNSGINLELEPIVDILKMISQQKKKNGRILVGFALETENLIENAKEKLRNKNLDYIVANGPENFDADEAAVKIIDKNYRITELPRLPKIDTARRILDTVFPL